MCFSFIVMKRYKKKSEANIINGYEPCLHVAYKLFEIIDLKL